MSINIFYTLNVLFILAYTSLKYSCLLTNMWLMPHLIFSSLFILYCFIILMLILLKEIPGHFKLIIIQNELLTLESYGFELISLFFGQLQLEKLFILLAQSKFSVTSTVDILSKEINIISPLLKNQKVHMLCLNWACIGKV